jgi:hypothetical protein
MRPLEDFRSLLCALTDCSWLSWLSSSLPPSSIPQVLPVDSRLDVSISSSLIIEYKRYGDASIPLITSLEKLAAGRWRLMQLPTRPLGLSTRNRYTGHTNTSCHLIPIALSPMRQWIQAKRRLRAFMETFASKELCLDASPMLTYF